jgi:hypothetical protein
VGLDVDGKNDHGWLQQGAGAYYSNDEVAIAASQKWLNKGAKKV